MRVAWFDAEGWEKDYIESLDHGLDIDFYEEPLDTDNTDLLGGYDAVTVFVTSGVDGEVINALEAQLICCRSTGYDHVDVEAARAQGLAVCNVRSTEAVPWRSTLLV